MGDRGDTLDFFLSYDRLDGDVVERVAEALRARGASVFLDRWYLTPGLPWPEALERALGRCRAVAVFIGANGMGPWQQREKYLALQRQTCDPAFPVIPVLLPGAQPALEFLRLNTWVDLSEDPVDGVGLDRLAAVAAGPAEHTSSGTGPAICPYRGLRYFREEDAPFFFGRTGFAERLTDATAREPLVAVIGASGSGKSSVVRSGLIPRLRRGAGGEVWEVVTMVPGDRPLHALAAAFVPLLESAMSEVDRLAEVGKLAGHLASGQVALRDVVRRVLESQAGTTRLLIAVDQWEELYTLAAEDAALKFAEQILDAVQHPSLRAVLTLRGDFFGRVLANRPLADALQDRVVNLGPMTRAELEEAVAKPAARVHLDFDDGLVTRILDDVGEEPGNLPLLEFVLTGLWDHREDGRLRHAAYEGMGGVQGAMARRAEEVWKGLGPQHEVLRRVFLQLVRPGAESADTRRRATLSELGDEAPAVLSELARERLVVTGRDEASGEETVEVAHEALIRHWGRLRSWLDADREFLAWRQRLRAAHAEWERTEHDRGALLGGALLIEAERWLGERNAELSPAERRYIESGVERRQRQRALRVAAAAVVVLLVAALALHQYREVVADRRALEAELGKRRPIEPEMVSVPAGIFEMGAPEEDDEAYATERPTRTVRVGAFKLARHEVTFGEYERFVLATGGRWPGDAGFGEGLEPTERHRLPVINVSWDEAVAYAEWLSGETGKRYRLPTEAEWEYAARAGTTERRFWGDGLEEACAYANVYDRGSEPAMKAQFGGAIDWDAHPCADGWLYTAPVGSFEPNGWELHDMLGNVYEWTADCWHDSYDGAPENGAAWLEADQGDCGRRVLRGGSWDARSWNVRSSLRFRLTRHFRGNGIGFRLARDQ